MSTIEHEEHSSARRSNAARPNSVCFLGTAIQQGPIELKNLWSAIDALVMPRPLRLLVSFVEIEEGLNVGAMGEAAIALHLVEFGGLVVAPAALGQKVVEHENLVADEGGGRTACKVIDSTVAAPFVHNGLAMIGHSSRDATSPVSSRFGEAISDGCRILRRVGAEIESGIAR